MLQVLYVIDVYCFFKFMAATRMLLLISCTGFEDVQYTVVAFRHGLESNLLLPPSGASVHCLLSPCVFLPTVLQHRI